MKRLDIDMADEENIDEKFKAQYNTKLSPEEETKYQSWVKAESKTAGRDLSKDEIDYDLRGDWKTTGGERDERGHGGDTYKKPNHPTFSEHSQYHGTKDEEGDAHEGGRWIKDKEGNTVAFEPGKTNEKHWPDWALKQYMQEAEPGLKIQKRK
jgi:hypothetical protein